MKVVIIEDEHLTATFLQETLENLGCEVTGTFDEGAAALPFAEENAIDLVFMNVEIQGDVNGVQLTIELRKRFNIPLTLITSHHDSATSN
jgi:two-component SAPR family response regulator